MLKGKYCNAPKINFGLTAEPAINSRSKVNENYVKYCIIFVNTILTKVIQNRKILKLSVSLFKLLYMS